MSTAYRYSAAGHTSVWHTVCCSLGIETVCLTVAAEGCNGKIRSVGIVLQATVVNIVHVSVVIGLMSDYYST